MLIAYTFYTNLTLTNLRRIPAEGLKNSSISDNTLQKVRRSRSNCGQDVRSDVRFYSH